MKALLAILALVGGAFAIVRRPSAAKRLQYEARKRTHTLPAETHSHEARTHDHDHYHVTHNRREGINEVVGEWEHLTAGHQHSHNHPALTHEHAPHEDADHEHMGEAHIHDHEHPTRS